MYMVARYQHGCGELPVINSLSVDSVDNLLILNPYTLSGSPLKFFAYTLMTLDPQNPAKRVLIGLSL